MLRSAAKLAGRAGKAELRAFALLASAESARSGGPRTLQLAESRLFGSAQGSQAALSSIRTFFTTPHVNAAQPEPESEPADNPLHGKKEDGESRNDGKIQELGYLMTYPKYDKAYLESITPKHKPPEQLYQKTALWAVTAMRWSFDKLTGYPGRMDECRWLRRIVFLETVAGMLRHLKSLRSMSRDHGWIHTLLEEAENDTQNWARALTSWKNNEQNDRCRKERMHLLTFLQIKQPGPVFRGFVLLTQGVFFNLYTMFYLISPKHCHAFVGYLEEEAVRTYTHCLEEIDSGNLPDWAHSKPPEIARSYWGLDEDATMRDLVLTVRADEYGHSHVNHTFSLLKQSDDNPFEKGSHQVP